MNRIVERGSCLSCRTTGAACLVLLLCVCVVTQMLGVPATLMDLLNSDVLTNSEPASEDASALSPSPEPERSRLLHSFAELRPVRRLPMFLTAVFRPPST
jgi:hypothetical protein